MFLQLFLFDLEFLREFQWFSFCWQLFQTFGRINWKWLYVNRLFWPPIDAWCRVCIYVIMWLYVKLVLHFLLYRRFRSSLEVISRSCVNETFLSRIRFSFFFTPFMVGNWRIAVNILMNPVIVLSASVLVPSNLTSDPALII